MTSNSHAEITTRNDIARDIITGFASGAPTLAGVFGFIDSALPLRMTMDEKVLQEFDGIVFPDSPS